MVQNKLVSSIYCYGITEGSYTLKQSIHTPLKIDFCGKHNFRIYLQMVMSFTSSKNHRNSRSKYTTMKYINLETSHLKRGQHERNLGKCVFLTEAILLHVTKVMMQKH